MADAIHSRITRLLRGRYGRVDASDEEVVDAARAADIHHRILNFVDGENITDALFESMY